MSELNNDTTRRRKIDIIEIQERDEPVLKAVAKQCEDALVGCGAEHFSDEELHGIATKSILPPNGNRENYKSKLIVLDGKPIGFMAYYEGFPFKDSVWINAFYLIPEYRGKKIGSQIMMSLKQNEMKNGYRAFGAIIPRMNLLGQNFLRKHHFSIDKKSLDKDKVVYFCVYEIKENVK